jgi:hypothetical protein
MNVDGWYNPLLKIIDFFAEKFGVSKILLIFAQNKQM